MRCIIGIGYDVGTYNLISCKRNDEGNLVYKREVNAFIQIPLDNDFVFNMMKKSGVPLILREDENVAYALGDAAVNMAYAMANTELRRPMKDGCVNPKEKDAFHIMNIMVHSLLDNVTKDREVLYYSVPANAVNSETDADYHNKILEAIFKAYKSKDGHTVDARPINEALAIIYAELESTAFTGVGVSCLCPGTKVYTNNGIVSIENVKEDDQVITHKGRYGTVSKVIIKDFEGVMTKIQIAGFSNNTDEYRFVDNHELYVHKNGQWQWIGCEELEVGDIVGEPVIKQDRNATKPSLNLCERITSSKKWYKRRIEATPDVQRMIGYFLGDGSINEKEGCIQFDFGVHEKSYVQDVQEIAEKFFGKTATETFKGETVSRVKIYSKGLVNWFKNHIYDDNKVKFYPWGLERLTDTECMNLLIGLVRSDGCVYEEQISFYNCNTRLIQLAKQLFSRIGLPSSVSYREARSSCLANGRVIQGKMPEWCVSSGGKKVYMSLIEKFNNINCANSSVKESIFLDQGFCCGRVQKIEHEDYSGPVYDLQVPGDHSFSGPQLTIHNCGAGMVNVCFSVFGTPAFTFSIVNSGDWIDKQASKATGESIAVINKKKHSIDLSKEPENMIERAIQTQYRLMIEKTVAGIKKGLQQHEKARLDTPVKIVVAGGTASPNGFEQFFKQVLDETPDLGVEVGEVIKPQDPVKVIAKGCLVAAENAKN